MKRFRSYQLERKKQLSLKFLFALLCDIANLVRRTMSFFVDWLMTCSCIIPKVPLNRIYTFIPIFSLRIFRLRKAESSLVFMQLPGRELSLKLTMKTPERRHWRRSDVFIFIFEHISRNVLLFPLLTWNK